MTKPYHIVEFLDDWSTYVVPEWWLERTLQGVFAHWPPLKSQKQLLQAIQQREPAGVGWTRHPARILQSYTSLQQATENINRAEVTSNLESDEPDTPPQKRMRYRAGRDARPPAPVQQSACSGPTLPAFPMSYPGSREEPTFHTLEVAHHARSVSPEGRTPFHFYEAAPALLPPAARASGHALEAGSANANGQWESRQQPVSCGEEEIGLPSSAADNGDRVVGMLQEMMRQQATERREQAAFWEQSLRNQADMLAQLRALRSQGATGVRVPLLPEDCPRLPVQSGDEMRALNAYLANVEKIEQMADYLRQMGGVDEKSAVRTVLTALISNSLAKQCSWAGSKGAKEALSEQGNILALVLGGWQAKLQSGL